jgi:hypothetical protein
MGYQITFLGISKQEAKDAKKEHRWPQEIINITPPLTDELITAIKPLTAQSGGCKDFGAQVLDVSQNKIIIHSCCPSCRRFMIEKITYSIGKKITIQVD